jgi:hypothetical protein
MSVPLERRNVEGRRNRVADEAALAQLLTEVAETHHRVYRITDGVDDDWASWYADWLLELSELPELIGRRPVRSHLVYALVQLDREYARESATEACRPTTRNGCLDFSFDR